MHAALEWVFAPELMNRRDPDTIGFLVLYNKWSMFSIETFWINPFIDLLSTIVIHHNLEVACWLVELHVLHSRPATIS